jgi:hypothetical protein
MTTTLLAVAGLPTTPPATAPLLVVAAGAGAVPVFREGWFSRLRQARPGGELVAVIPALWLGAKAIAGAARIPVVSGDEYSIWALRGRLLSLAGHFDQRIGLNAAAGYQHTDYPLGVPAMVAWSDGWLGRTSDAAAHAQVALVFVAMLLAGAWVAHHYAGPLGGIAAVVLLGGIADALPRYAVLLFGDVPVAAYTVAMVAVAAVWLDHRDGRLLGVVGVLAAGAVLVKNEGSLAAVAVLAAVTVANAGRGREWRPVAFAWAATVCAALPWAAYTRAHGVQSDVVNAQTLAPHALRANLHLLGPVLTGLRRLWPGVRGVVAVLPFVAAATALATPGRRRLVALFAASLSLSLAGLVLVYVGGFGHLHSSAYRTLLAPAALVAVAIPVLAGAAIRTPPGTAADEPRDGCQGVATTGLRQ